ncbi:Beta-lactamase domain-containing protein [Mycena chlorophos]|uniref:Beta-lactamase domain-containing protein n=1 Tax=Mycena chlorophos TaxID=658473 RepID=A0A8H6SIG2_MYCCL|nr:Beta-lactamase domain-containing protein [Mycena chlorophos]
MDKLDALLAASVAKPGEKTTKDQLLGVAAVIVNKDGVLYRGSAGVESTKPGSAPFTPDSVTAVASMTKIITATTAMRLVEQGKIGLDDDVRPLIPKLAAMQILRGFLQLGQDVPYLEENTTPITLRQLLLHTAGNFAPWLDPDCARWAKYTGFDYLARYNAGTSDVWDTPLKFTPGHGWVYGSGLAWAGLVVEAVSGQRFGDFMRAEVFDPLGMPLSTFKRLELPSFVPSADRDPETGAITSREEETMPVDPQAQNGGGGLYMSAIEHTRVLQSLLRSLSGEKEGVVLRKETVEEMFRPQLNAAEKRMLDFTIKTYPQAFAPEFHLDMPLQYGISGMINLEDEPGKRKRGSMMWSGMYNSHWFVDPETGIAVALFTNVSPFGDAALLKLWDQLERTIYGDFLPSL